MWNEATYNDALRARVSFLEGEMSALAAAHSALVCDSEGEIRALEREVRAARRRAEEMEALLRVIKASLGAVDSDDENYYAFNAKRPRRADAIQAFDERWGRHVRSGEGI